MIFRACLENGVHSAILLYCHGSKISAAQFDMEKAAVPKIAVDQYTEWKLSHDHKMVQKMRG